MAFIKWFCDRYQVQHYQDPCKEKEQFQQNFFHTQRPVFLVTLFLINKTETFYIPPALNNIILFFFFVLKSLLFQK